MPYAGAGLRRFRLGLPAPAPGRRGARAGRGFGDSRGVQAGAGRVVHMGAGDRNGGARDSGERDDGKSADGAPGGAAWAGSGAEGPLSPDRRAGSAGAAAPESFPDAGPVHRDSTAAAAAPA
jgi:hypothetical protein